MVVGGGGHTLAGGGWCWTYFGWLWVVVDGGGWWWNFPSLFLKHQRERGEEKDTRSCNFLRYMQTQKTAVLPVHSRWWIYSA